MAEQVQAVDIYIMGNHYQVPEGLTILTALERQRSIIARDSLKGCLKTTDVIASPALRVILSVAKNLMALRTGSAKQSHSCLLPPRLLQHCVPRNDERKTC